MLNPFFSLQGPSGQTRPDNIKLTKSALKFGPLSISRGNTVPPMDYGRPGDLVIIDNTDSPSTVLQSLQEPTSVGLWLKLPLSNYLVPAGATVIGFPAAISSAGDVISINGVSVALSAPYDVTTAVNDINAAAIPNVSALNINDALAINESTGGAITIFDTFGSATATLGIYTQKSIAELAAVDEIFVNGLWLPVGYTGSTGGASGGAPVGGAYLTLANDIALTSERVFTPGAGLSTTDGGPGGAFTIGVDMSSAPALSEPLDSTDELLVFNSSTGQIERATFNDLPGGVSTTEAVQQRTSFIGTAASNPLGVIVPAGAVVRRVTLQILSAYDPGVTISIGDIGNASRLMTAADNDPTEINTFETTSIIDYVAATQVLVTVGGIPTAGSSRVIVDFIVP